jgi:transcriptional regulator with XRE-family HTH domain
MEIDRELLGKAIRQVRAVRGMSQANLAEQAGLKSNTVALIERGQRGVSMESLNALAGVLRVPAACLTMLGTPGRNEDSGTQSLVQSLQSLIAATIDTQARLEAEENAELSKQRQIQAAVSSIPRIESLLEDRPDKGKRGRSPKSGRIKQKRTAPKS